jgi:hypothetical protein
MTAKIDNPPPWLAESGKRLWTSTIHDYRLDASQRELLGVGCKLADRLAECREHLRNEMPVVVDRFGQEKLSPWAVLELQTSGQLSRLLGRLLAGVSRRVTGDAAAADEFFGGPQTGRTADLYD